MIELIAHNLAPIMFTSVMALLLLGYPVAFTLAAGGLLYFVIGVELSQYAPDQITLAYPLMQAQPNRMFDLLRGETAVTVTGVFLIWFALSDIRPAASARPGLGQLVRNHELALVAVALFALAPYLLPVDAYELTAASAVVVVSLRAMRMTPSRRGLAEVLGMTAQAAAAAMLVLIGFRIAGLPFYGIGGGGWIHGLDMSNGYGLALIAALDVLICVLPVRAVTHTQARLSGVAA